MNRLDLILKNNPELVGGNISDIFCYLSNNSNKYLCDETNKIKFDFINEKNNNSYINISHQKRYRGEEIKNTMYYKNGGNAVVFYIKDDNNKEYLIKIMKIQHRPVDEYLTYFNDKYLSDKLKYSINIPELYYFGKINKEGEINDNYYYYITKIYNTNFEILNIQNKIILLHDLCLLLKTTNYNKKFINDLKLANIGYINDNIILIDYDTVTINDIYTNNINNGTYYPYYAMKEMYDKILIPYQLVNKQCLDDKNKHLKLPVIGLLDIIFCFFYKYDLNKKLLYYLYNGGNYNGIELKPCAKIQCNNYYEKYQNLNDNLIIEQFIDKINEISRLYDDNNDFYLKLKQIIFGLLEKDYTNIISYEMCISFIKMYITNSFTITTPIKSKTEHTPLPFTPPTEIISYSGGKYKFKIIQYKKID